MTLANMVAAAPYLSGLVGLAAFAVAIAHEVRVASKAPQPVRVRANAKRSVSRNGMRG